MHFVKLKKILIPGVSLSHVKIFLTLAGNSLGGKVAINIHVKQHRQVTLEQQ